MAMKIVALDPNAVRRQEVVDMARDILARAEAGNLVDLSYSAAMPDGCVTTGFTATDDAHRRLAGVSRLLHRLHQMADEQAEY